MRPTSTPSTDKRGFTLIEVMVAAGLAVLFLGIMLGVFIPALRYSAKSQAKLELQQVGVIALTDITRELQSSRVAGISYGSDFLGVHPISGVTSEGAATWEDELTLYQWDSSQKSLLKHFATASQPGPELISAIPGPAQIKRTKTVARNLEGFVFTPPTPATGTDPPGPLELSLLFQKDYAGSEDPIRLELKSKISLRGDGG